MINITILMGRLTADPELKFTANGISYCRFTLAIERSYTKAGAERQTDFISCIAWRGTADFVDKYFMKGQLIAVQGSIQTGTYTDNDNVKHYTFDVLVSSVSFTGDKRENGTQTSDVQYKPSEKEKNCWMMICRFSISADNRKSCRQQLAVCFSAKRECRGNVCHLYISIA